MFSIRPEQINIRTTLNSGDIGYITFLHSLLYKEEYGLGTGFENYVAAGLNEFYTYYEPEKDKIWICEHNQTIVGSLILTHRPDNLAQLRYFLLLPEYRSIGLGRKLMQLFVEELKAKKYAGAFLWTTNELTRAGHLYEQYGFTRSEQKETEAFGKTVVEERYDLILH